MQIKFGTDGWRDVIAAKYNGFKIKGDYGGAALPDIISEIESVTNSADNRVHTTEEFHNHRLPSFADLLQQKQIEEIDAKAIYIKELAKLVKLDRIKRS